MAMKIEAPTMGESITEASYASALDASIVSDSGETVSGDIEYSGLNGVFNVLFTMTRVGKASLEVKYQTSNGFARIDDVPQVINIIPSSISVKNSELECVVAKDVTKSEGSKCILTTFDAYMNPTGSKNNEGAFSILATKPGEQTITSTKATHIIDNTFSIYVKLDKSGTWDIEARYFTNKFSQKISLTLLPGPLNIDNTILILIILTPY